MGAISINTALAKGANTTVFGPLSVGKSATVNINVCNRSTASAKVRVAISPTEAPASKDWIEYDTQVSQAARPGDHIVCMSNGGFGGIHAKLLLALQK